MGITQEIGRRGEDAAVDYLRTHGFVIRDLNWRRGRYEVDIVAERAGEIHFVEVKSRKAAGWTTPEQAIDRRKVHALQCAASAYLALFPSENWEPCFDLCAVESHPDGRLEVRFLPDAMEAHW